MTRNSDDRYVDQQEKAPGTDKGVDNSMDEATETQSIKDHPNTPHITALKSPQLPEPRIHRPSRQDEPFEQWERDAMEHLLTEVRGHLGKMTIRSVGSIVYKISSGIPHTISRG